VQATVDSRVVGFRPERGVKVPVVPLAAEYEAWIEQSLAAAEAEINDNFGFDPVTGELVSGPDGIPELTFLCGRPAEQTSSEETTAANASEQSAEPKDAEEATAEEQPDG
jgi:hypothetical protein